MFDVDARLAKLREMEKAQKEWIARCGGDLAGYIEEYGIPGEYKEMTINLEKIQVPLWHGDGGEAIYAADQARLQQIQQEIRFLTGAEKTKGVPEKMPEGYFCWRLIDGQQGSTLLKDLLHNFSKRENGSSFRYERGLLVGAITALMAAGMEFEDAARLLWQHMPPNNEINYDRIPEAMRRKHFGEV